MTIRRLTAEPERTEVTEIVFAAGHRAERQTAVLLGMYAAYRSTGRLQTG